ncbi:MAG: CD1871A family CXXC motif-containing protein [Evtepia sp.]
MKYKLQIVWLIVALLLIGVGTARGEVAEVLNKGINLCLECVGIG